MPVPQPTEIFRFIHIDNLHLCLDRGGLHAPNHCPNDGGVYRTIHNEAVQNGRHKTPVPCGPGGTIHDYVPFYFGYLSPMMLNLKTGRVAGYNEGQEPLIYLVTTAQVIHDSGYRYVFSDGHGLAGFTDWFYDLANLSMIDWGVVYLRYWHDTLDDMDRQRRKQAEFLIHQFCEWSVIQFIGVINENMQRRVEQILAEYPRNMRRPVIVRRDWYYH